MRTVLQGTATNLYRLREIDLPADHDLKWSFWKWVDFSDFDLSDYDCRLMDIPNSKGHNVILPDNVDWVVSNGTSWTGSRIPALVPSRDCGLVCGVLEQNTMVLGSKEAEASDWVVNVRQHQDRFSSTWWDAIWHFQAEMKMSKEEIYKAFSERCFGGYPRLLSALHNYLSVVNGPADNEPHSTQHAEVGLRGATYHVEHNKIRFMGTEDRGAAARMAEQYLEQVSHISGWRVFVLQLWPEVNAMISHPDIGATEEMWWPKQAGI